MTLNKLKYGIVLTASTLIIGTSLWFERNDNQVKAQDIIEVRQGTVERCLATQNKSLPTTSIYTNVAIYDPTYTNRLFYISEVTQPRITTTNTFILGTTNNFITNNYFNIQEEIAGYNTNDTFISGSDILHSGYQVNPPYYCTNFISTLTNNTITVTNYTPTATNYALVNPNKFIIYGWSNIVVTGFTDAPDVFLFFGDYSKFNGNYKRVTKDYYTNTANDSYLTWNKDITLFSDDYNFAQKPYYPFVTNEFICSSFFASTTTNKLTINDIVGQNMITNALETCQIWKVTPYDGWALFNGLSSYDREFGEIDSRLKIFTNDTIYSIYYIKKSLFNTNSFNLLSDLTITNLSINTNKYQITTNNLYLEYKALSELETTYNKTITFIAPYASNVVVREGRSNTSFADAIQIASTNVISYTTANGPPYCFTVARVDTNSPYLKWTVRGYSRAAKMQLSCLSTDIMSQVAFYTKSTNDNRYLGFGSYFIPCNTNVFYGFDETDEVYTNFWSDLTWKNRTNAISSLILGSNNPVFYAILPTFSDPSNATNNYTFKGYTPLDAGVMAKWQFLYCTNSF